MERDGLTVLFTKVIEAIRRVTDTWGRGDGTTETGAIAALIYPDAPKLDPITEAGSGNVQEKEKAWLNEIIEKVNNLFDGDLTEQGKLVYVNNVIKGKPLESEPVRPIVNEC